MFDHNGVARPKVLPLRHMHRMRGTHMSPLIGHTTNFPNDVLLDMGILMVGTSVLGVTKGPPQFSPEIELAMSEFDGMHAPLKGMDRFFYGPAQISATIMEFGDSATGNQLAKLFPGSSTATAGSPSVTTITPKAGGGFLASGDYLTDFRMIFQRGISTGLKQYFAIYFPVGLVLPTFTLQGEPRKYAQAPITIAARKDASSGNVYDAPFKLELREAVPA